MHATNLLKNFVITFMIQILEILINIHRSPGQSLNVQNFGSIYTSLVIFANKCNLFFWAM